METKIYYKITFPNDTCYIGCAKDFNRRMAEHRCNVKRNKHGSPGVQDIYNKYGLDNWIYEILFTETGDIQYHSKREHDLIQNTSKTLNKRVGKWATLGKKEYDKQWRENNKEKQKEYLKKFKNKNK